MPAIKDIDLTEFESYEFSSPSSAPKPVRRDKVRFGRSNTYIVAQQKANAQIERETAGQRFDRMQAEEAARIEQSFSYKPDEGYADPRK